MTEGQELERVDAVQDYRAELAQSAGAGSAPTLFGTSDPAAIVERIAGISDVLMQAVRTRGLARKYGDNPREFLHIEAWQFLGSMLGVTARVEWTRPLADGAWEARAEVVNAAGVILGSGEGMAGFKADSFARGRRNAHSDRAMAQVRARRTALRSVLGFVAVIGGLDLADPYAPATREQVVALHAIAGEREWSREESHQRAGVESFNDLTREQAAELIDTWQIQDETLAGGDAIPIVAQELAEWEISGSEGNGEGAQDLEASGPGEGDAGTLEPGPDFTFATGDFAGRQCSEVASSEDGPELLWRLAAGRIQEDRRPIVIEQLVRAGVMARGSEG